MSQYSKSQEYRLRDFFRKRGLNAERVPLSGAGLEKGDVSVEDGLILVDTKSTIGVKSISIKREDLEKIQKDAGEENLGLITFTYKSQREIYVVLPLSKFLDLIIDKIKDIAKKRKECYNKVAQIKI
ncbi:MAG: hypothetical protein AABY07_00330 [Nanoarchaeota archaeon]